MISFIIEIYIYLIILKDEDDNHNHHHWGWYDFIKEKKEERAPAIGAKATYGGIKAPAGAILIARKEGPTIGHIDGQHCPVLYYN